MQKSKNTMILALMFEKIFGRWLSRPSPYGYWVFAVYPQALHKLMTISCA
jgi:hypothetical protein